MVDVPKDVSRNVSKVSERVLITLELENIMDLVLK